MSRTVRSATKVPRRATDRTSPSCSRRFRASRTGVRLTPISLASWYSESAVPTGRVDARIFRRICSYARVLMVVAGVWLRGMVRRRLVKACCTLLIRFPAGARRTLSILAVHHNSLCDVAKPARRSVVGEYGRDPVGDDRRLLAHTEAGLGR